jgi:ABC-type polysaccharide/polyol phosphate transport system ATPase subunit
MAEPAIHVDHVWKKFRKGQMEDSLRDLIPSMCARLLGRAPRVNKNDFWALNDVTFEVQQGESIGIIGPNGAGKSTLLKLLSRIIRPNKGSYHVNGRLSALIEVGAGFHQDLTGRENIYLNGAILGMARKEIRGKEEAIIDFAGVEEFIDTPVKRYSSGMKARLGFAVAAHMEPDVLLVDEVLSVGDARFRQKCINHMNKLIRSNVTVVFISHILDQVRQLCPNTIVLDRGAIVYNGETEGAIRTYLDLLAAQDGPEVVNESAPAEVRNIVLRNAEGEETLDLQSRQPVMLDCELVVRHKLRRPALLINVSSVGGVYMGTAHSRRDGMELPTEPGTYRLRFTMDPMVIADGDFMFEFKLHDDPDGHVIWAMRQPRMVSVRGSGVLGPLIHVDGQWEMLSAPAIAGSHDAINPNSARQAI